MWSVPQCIIVLLMKQVLWKEEFYQQSSEPVIKFVRAIFGTNLHSVYLMKWTVSIVEFLHSTDLSVCMEMSLFVTCAFDIWVQHEIQELSKFLLYISHLDWLQRKSSPGKIFHSLFVANIWAPSWIILIFSLCGDITSVNFKNSFVGNKGIVFLHSLHFLLPNCGSFSTK